MRKISTYSSMFEGKAEDEKLEAFNRALNSPEGKDFQKWFDIKHVRTGRAYIHKKNEIKGMNIPSRSYFDLSGYIGGGEWYYEFASSSGSYGTTYNQDLKSLFRIFMVDAVRKSRPSSITEKQIKEFFSKESNFPKGSFPNPDKIYSSITQESGVVVDFSFLMELPIIKRISDLGVKVYTSENSGLTSVSMDFKSSSNLKNILETIFGKEYSDSLKEIVKEIPKDSSSSSWGNWYIDLFESLSLYKIDPKTKPGKNVYNGRTSKELRIGSDSKEKIEKYTEEFIKGNSTLITATFKKDWNQRIYIRPLEDLIKKTILGEPIGNLKEESKERIEEILLDLIGPHIGKNPLDLYLVDAMPDLKEKIMKEYGIEKDFSKLGRAFGKGFL
jgi:hypothetical protein